MKPKLLLVVLLSTIFTVSNGQVKQVAAKSKTSKVSTRSDIRNLPDLQVWSTILNREYSKMEGRPKYKLRMNGDFTFQMWFSNDKPDDYSSTLKTSLRNGYTYQRVLKGDIKIVKADEKKMGRGVFDMPEKNEFGEVEPVFIYIKYYVIFKGTDENGKEYEMCTRLYQLFDHDKRERWYLGFINRVPGCSCSAGDGKNKDVWIDGFYL